MTFYVIYTDGSGLVYRVYANCDTLDNLSAYTRTVQENGTPPAIDPSYAPAASTTPSVQDQINAVVAQLTAAQQAAIKTALASAAIMATLPNIG